MYKRWRVKLKIVTTPAPILHKVAKPVQKVDGFVRELLTNMAETMYAESGVGIAAPQVGVSLRVVCIDISGTSYDVGLGLLKIVNPEIIEREGELEWEEGCLSVPEFTMKMKRSRKIKVRFLNEKGEPQELVAEGLLAVAFQQEIDHLDGKLILDNASPLKQDIYLKKLKKK